MKIIANYFRNLSNFNLNRIWRLPNAYVKNKIGNRAGRIEPRAIKRRPKAFPLLKKSRDVEKNKLMRKVKKIKSEDVMA